MGALISQYKSDNVSWEMLQSEIAALNQDETCEVDTYPGSDNEENSENEDIQQDSLQRYDRCNKKHEHDKFIPINDLTLNHLPLTARYPCVLTYIRQQAIRTVKIVVCHTAQERPDSFGLSSLKGTSRRRVGTGSVDIKRSNVDIPGFPPGSIFFIVTAAHVVFDNDEVKKTTVQFCFDDDVDRSKIVVARGVKMCVASIRGDKSLFMCQMADIEKANDLRMKLNEPTPKSKVFSSFNLAFGISHPHGVAKRISFGKLLRMKETTFSKNDLHTLTLLFSKLTKEEDSVDEKKVFYYFVKELQIIGILKRLKPGVKIHNPLPIVMKYLEDLDLVKEPSESEMSVIHKARLRYLEEGKSFILSELSKPKFSVNITPDAKKKIVDELSQGYTRDAAALHTLASGCKERYNKVYQAMFAKLNELVFEDKASNTGFLTTFWYSIPTCEGSSGCFVHSLDYRNGEKKHIYGQHARGGGRRGNRTCGGKVTYLD